MGCHPPHFPFSQGNRRRCSNSAGTFGSRDWVVPYNNNNNNNNNYNNNETTSDAMAAADAIWDKSDSN